MRETATRTVTDLAALRCAHALCSASSLAELESTFLVGFGRLLRTPMHGMYVLDPDTGGAKRTASVNVSDTFLARYERGGRELDPLLAHVLATERTAYNVELMPMAEWLDSPLQRHIGHLHDLHHVVEVPVINGQGIVGTLNFGTSDASRGFTVDELRLAEYIGRVIGASIESIRARNRMERDREQALLALELAGTAVVICEPSAVELRLNEAARALLAEVVDGEGRFHDLTARRGSVGAFSRRLEVELVTGGIAILHGYSRHTATDGGPLITVLELQRDEPEMATKPLVALTAREREVALLVADGLADREIAEKLHLSRHTVSQYVKNIYRKLDLGSRVELTRLLVVPRT